MITQTRLRELLDYNELTGVFTWKTSRRGVKAGGIAGSLNSNGYILVVCDGRRYLAHRLVWLYTHGGWPTYELDHKDLVKTNNALTNLRDVSHRENMQNLQRHRNGRLAGTTFFKRDQNWFARIRIAGQQKFLGYYPSELEAHLAYKTALAGLTL